MLSPEELEEWWRRATQEPPGDEPMDDATWLAERRTGLGSSDAAAACGMSDWGTPLSVYLDKRGLLRGGETRPMRWGKKLEAVVADAYAEETGRLVGPPAERILRHPEHAWLLASLDRESYGGMEDPLERRILECKTSRTAEGWGPAGTDLVPDGYLLQVQHQMMVTGIVLADVAVLIGGQELRIYTVPASPVIHGRLLDIERELWQRILRRDAPAPDWTHPGTPALLDVLHRPDSALTITMPRPDLVAAWERLGCLLKETERSRDEVKARIVEAMGPAGFALLPDGRCVRRKVVEVKEHTRRATSYVDFKIMKGQRK